MTLCFRISKELYHGTTDLCTAHASAYPGFLITNQDVCACNHIAHQNLLIPKELSHANFQVQTCVRKYVYLIATPQ